MRSDDAGPRLNDSRESPSDEALERYLAGRSTAPERAVVERWLEETPERAATARALAREVSSHPPRFDAEAMLVATRVRMDDADRLRGSRWRHVSAMVGSRSTILLAAAVLLLALGLSTYTPTRQRERIAVPETREFVAKRGQQETVNLPDGSHVVLAAGSTLRVPGTFNERGPGGVRRELDLTGKAFFRVEHDERRPFLVRTATAITEDTGTEFVVRAYPESRATQVVVVSGSVALHRVRSGASTASTGETTMARALERPLVVLTPGDVAELGADGTVSLARNVNTATHVSWTTGVLVLDGTRLRDALAELSRWFDVDFRMESDALDSLRVSGEFRTESVDVAAQRLGLMLGVRTSRDGRTVVLSPDSAR